MEVFEFIHVKCNLCGIDESEHLWSKNGFNAVRCKRCGLIYTNPRLVLSESPDFYNESFFVNENIDHSDVNTYRNYFEDVPRRRFVNLLKEVEGFFKPPGKLLDVGCAIGLFLEVAGGNGWDVQGTDFSRWAVDFVMRKYGLEIFQGDLTFLNLKSNFYDVVTMWDIIEHVPDPINNLREVCRILKPGGLLALETTNSDDPLVMHVYRHRWGLFMPKQHLNFWSSKTITRALVETGFQVVDMKYSSSRPIQSFFRGLLFNVCWHVFKLIVLKTKVDIQLGPIQTRKWKRKKIRFVPPQLTLRDIIRVYARKPV